MTTPPALSDSGVHPDDVAALGALVATGVPGNLVVLTSADGDPAPAAARSCAELLLTDPQARMLDVHLAVPAGDRWTIDEIDSEIIGPARMRAFERTHVIVVDADAMTSTAADHLLKTVEEPSSGAVFWFCVRDDAALKTTILGRATAVLQTRPAPVTDRIAALVDGGADPQAAAEVAVLAGADLQLARAVLADPALLEPLRVLAAAPLRGVTTPTSTAFTLLEAVTTLATATGRATAAAAAETAAAAADAKPRRARKAAAPKAPAKAKPGNPWATLPAEHKPAARRLLRRLLGRWRTELPADTLTAGSAAELEAVARAAAAIDAAGAELSTHASPLVVLAAAFARAG